MARDNSPTERRGYERPPIGDDWADAWDGLVEDTDELAVERGPIADRPATGAYDDALYLAVDQRTLWRWDAAASDWEAVSGLGTASDPVPGTSHFESVSTETTSIGGHGAVTGFETGTVSIAAPDTQPADDTWATDVTVTTDEAFDTAFETPPQVVVTIDNVQSSSFDLAEACLAIVQQASPSGFTVVLKQYEAADYAGETLVVRYIAIAQS